jgi:hypothetical protein
MKAQDILQDLSKDNIQQYLRLSSSLLSLYSSDNKYKNEEKKLMQEVQVLQNYYNNNFDEKIPISIQIIKNKFNNLCNSSDIHSSTVSVKTDVNENVFTIRYKSYCCDLSSMSFRNNILNPRIEKTMGKFLKYLDDNNIKYIKNKNTSEYSISAELLF